MKITGTFLDEISHDIPHQNWGWADWDRDFQAMKAIGIDTVIMIRCGHQQWMTYPSEVLAKRENGYTPPVDLVDMYLDLAEKYGMKFFFGTYDSGKYWHNRQHEKELAINQAVVEEVWKKYGHRQAFKGWYMSQEISRRYDNIVDIYAAMGKFCKEISGGLPVLISPYIDGVKAVSAFSDSSRKDTITVEQHYREWNEILDGIKGAIDVVAFQDGHCDYHELSGYLQANMELARRYGMECWTNCESFDRDMPIKFLPIKWEKMLLKLKATETAGIEKAITFEFSHFMSPNSCYPQAAKLYERYCEYLSRHP